MTRILRWSALMATLIALTSLGVGCFAFSGPRYRGAVTDHFDGKEFRNQSEVPRRGFKDFLHWMANREVGRWRPWVESIPGPPPPKSVPKGALRVTFINHATTLVQLDGVNVLTDPIWSTRASPVAFAGPKRIRDPGIRFEDLPPIHIVVVSHNHYDHLDLPTLRRLADVHKPRMFVGLGNRKLLEDAGIEHVTELDWWQSEKHPSGIEVRAVPAQHFSRRGLCDGNATLWAGWLLHATGGTVFFAGDTGFGPHFQQIREKYGPPRLALLPIGAYRPEWFMAPVHISPDEAVRAHQALEARQSAAIHYGTFMLADDGEFDPLFALNRALSKSGIDLERFWVLEFGEGRDVSN